MEFVNGGGTGSVEPPRRAGGHRGRRRIGSLRAHPVRPLPPFTPRRPRSSRCPWCAARRPASRPCSAAAGSLRPAGSRPASRARSAGRFEAQPDEGAGEVQTPLRASGRRHSPRRPGLVPSRQGRRAVRARQRVAPGRRRQRVPPRRTAAKVMPGWGSSGVDGAVQVLADQRLRLDDHRLVPGRVPA